MAVAFGFPEVVSKRRFNAEVVWTQPVADLGIFLMRHGSQHSGTEFGAPDRNGKHTQERKDQMNSMNISLVMYH